MGWASGAGLLDSVLSATYHHLPDAVRAEVCERLYEAFRQQDLDDWSGFETFPAFQAVIERRQAASAAAWIAREDAWRARNDASC